MEDEIEYLVWKKLDTKTQQFLLNSEFDDIKSIELKGEDIERDGVDIYIIINNDIHFYVDWVGVEYAAAAIYAAEIESAFDKLKVIFKECEEYRLEDEDEDEDEEDEDAS